MWVLEGEMCVTWPQVKCHQYWPNPGSSTSYGTFQIECHTEEGNSAFLVRDVTLTNLEVSSSFGLSLTKFLAACYHSDVSVGFAVLLPSPRMGCCHGNGADVERGT